MNVEAKVDRVLAEDPYWFPVRHHSPTVARHLEAALRARKPKVVFLEGPSEANHLIPHVVDPKSRPPLAIYSSYRDDGNVLKLAGVSTPSPDIPARFSCWYPLTPYSPEYVALRTAKEIGADVVFMDLPHHALIRPHSEEKPEAAPEIETEKLIVGSSFYRDLAAAAGYRTWDEAWDSLFEMPARSLEEFRRELAAFCAAARETSTVDEETLQRERFMIRTIRETLKKRKLKPESAMIVCGGYHLFLDREDAVAPPEPPAGTLFTTVVPYSFFRISEHSGYAAGNRAPQFYQLLHDLRKEGREEDLLGEFVTSVLRRARQEGGLHSAADAIAVSQTARMLAALRGRARPVLDDIRDALVTCCVKGDPEEDGAPLRRATDAVAIGSKIGRVTPAVGHLPLLGDFYALLDELNLGEVMGKEKRLPVTLDKRKDEDARRSAFLHRLKFLEVPLAKLAEAPDRELASGTIFRESWVLQWTPKVESELIERNLYGDTVQSAALARLREELARSELQAGLACRRLVEATDMDFPDLVAQAEEACGRAIDGDRRFVSQTEALGHLQVLDRYAVYRNLRRDLLQDLIVRCFHRACFAIPEVASVPDDQHKDVVAGLSALAEAVLRDEGRLDRAVFSKHVKEAATVTTVPFLRGIFLGLLAEIRESKPEELAGEVSAYALAPSDRMVVAGDFLDGVMTVSRTSIMVGADALIGAVDDLLRAADGRAFLTMVPRMRAAFERLHERQRESLAGRVAQKYGLAEASAVTELRTSAEAAALFAEIDRRVARIMKDWEF